MFSPNFMAMPNEVRHQLAPFGILRAGINLSNFLLVSGRTAEGDPIGISPDMARAIADNLELQIKFVTYPSPSEVADAAARDEWDIALIGAEPQRAEVISFTQAYAEIEATYLVPAGSKLQGVADVDIPGVRIAVTNRTAYGLWLDRNIRQAELVRTSTLDTALATFIDQKLDALAGLRPRLISDVEAVPGSRILDGHFMSVQQAVGTPKSKEAAVGYLARFVTAARDTGFVTNLIHKHGVQGVSVPQPAPG